MQFQNLVFGAVLRKAICHFIPTVRISNFTKDDTLMLEFSLSFYVFIAKKYY